VPRAICGAKHGVDIFLGDGQCRHGEVVEIRPRHLCKDGSHHQLDGKIWHGDADEVDLLIAGGTEGRLRVYTTHLTLRMRIE